MDSREYLALTVDPTRLAVLGAAATGPVDATALADALGVQPKKVLVAVARLRDAGLLKENLTLDTDAVHAVGASLAREDPSPPDVADGSWTNEEVQVLGRFFEGKVLKQIPVGGARRLVVLERLAQEFEPGVRYPEREVNETLQLFNPDYVTLRRYMVDEGIFTRADGFYWRTGGRLET